MRSAEFDRETVLRSAMNAFMHKGYNKTSMQDLKAATGLHPGSIYCAFENKKGLLLAAIGQYNQDSTVFFNAFFEKAPSPLAGLNAYLNHIVEQCLSCEPEASCLLQKALNELAEQDSDVQTLVTEQLHRWQAGLEAIIEKGILAGEIIGLRDAKCRARSLVMSIYGLRTYGYTHPEPDELKALAKQVINDISV